MILFLLLCLVAPAAAQRFSHRGFFETRSFLYPQTVPNDRAHFVGEALLRWEASYKLTAGWQLNGAFDGRTDTHHQVERDFRLDWQDRTLQQPALSARRFSAAWHRGRFSAEFGKQFIRWGKADILNPTDRFAPRDYINVASNDFLGVLGARVIYEGDKDSLDLVAVPRFTPARTPLLDQRWVAVPEPLSQVPLHDLGARFPGRAQFGVRWNRTLPTVEYALVFFDGFHYLPLIEARPVIDPVAIEIQRYYPQLRLYGGDIAVPLRWFTVKAEAAWFGSKTSTADEYCLYVIQLERTAGEWFFIGGYSGEAVTLRRNTLDFAPDRGLARAFLGRAGYTIDPRRSFAVETVVRQDGDGLLVKGEYSQQYGRHWRITASFHWIAGELTDFLGQYRRNSFGLATLRYSF